MNTIRFYDQERDCLMTKVERGIRNFCYAKNLYAWEDGIDDCLSMVAAEMCRRDFKDRPAFYIAVGNQLMISMARDKSCIKRRVNYDKTIRVDIDETFDAGFEDRNIDKVLDNKEDRIIKKCKEKFGEEIAKYIEGLVKGTGVKDRQGKELSDARLALKVKQLFRGKDINELREVIKSFENE